MDLGKSIENIGRQEVVIKSIIWNTIISEFQKYKQIDITSYLVSIRITKNTVFIKTNKPIINSEILLIEKEIIHTSTKKISKLGLKFGDFEIKLS